MMRVGAVWTLGLVLAACATSPAAPPAKAPVAVPLGGTVLWTRDAGFTVEVRVLSPGEGGDFAGPPQLPGVIATNAEELPPLYRPAQPIDFERFVAVGVPGGQFNAIDAGTVLTLEQLQATSDEEIQFVLPTGQCHFCGGASITAELARNCWVKVPIRLFLLPRPKARLIIGFADQSCNPALP